MSVHYQKLLLILVITGFNIDIVTATDITITATPATSPPGNNGALLVEIDTEASPPFDITINGPEGAVYTQNIDSHSFTQSDLVPGNYCIAVLNQTGCQATTCIDVSKCYASAGTFFCSVITPACCWEDLFVTGNPSSYDSGLVPVTYNFEAHHSLPASAFDSIVQCVFKQALATTDQIVRTGSSPYDVTHQNELESEDAFIYKFSQQGILQWAYHRAGNYPNSGAGQIQIFPNPTNDNISLSFNQAIYYQVTLLDTYGRQISLTLIPNVAADLQIETVALPRGLYILHFKGNNHSNTFLKFVKLID